MRYNANSMKSSSTKTIFNVYTGLLFTILLYVPFVRLCVFLILRCRLKYALGFHCSTSMYSKCPTRKKAGLP